MEPAGHRRPSEYRRRSCLRERRRCGSESAVGAHNLLETIALSLRSVVEIAAEAVKKEMYVDLFRWLLEKDYT